MPFKSHRHAASSIMYTFIISLKRLQRKTNDTKPELQSRVKAATAACTIFLHARACPAMQQYKRQKPITRLLLRFAFLDSVAVVGTRVTAAINCGFLFCLFCISVLYWALLFWFPLCRNKPGAKGREGKTRLNSWPHSCIQAHTPLSISIRRIMEPKISQPPKRLMQYAVPQDNQLNTHTPQQDHQDKSNKTDTQSELLQHPSNGSTQTFWQRCRIIFNLQVTDAIQNWDLFMIGRTSQRPHLLPDEVRDVRGSFGRRGDVGGVDWVLKGAGSHPDFYSPSHEGKAQV